MIKLIKIGIKFFYFRKNLIQSLRFQRKLWDSSTDPKHDPKTRTDKFKY